MNGEYQVQTDKKEKIKLDSDIVEATWLCGAAHGGTNAALKVTTYAVAERSSIEIKGFSSKGKAPGTIKGEIYNNEFTGELPIPEKVELGAQIGFEAKLPKHGLKQDCQFTIPAIPAIQVSKMCWDKTEVHRGDIVTLTTQFVNPLPGAQAQIIIYEYDPDGHHEKYCSFPVEIENDKIEVKWEFPSTYDVSQIPTEEERQKYQKHYVPVEFFFLVVIDGVRVGEGQESGKLKFKDAITINLTDGEGKECADIDYTLDGPDNKVTKGKSDKSGTINVKDLPAGPYKLSFAGISFAAKVGTVEKIDGSLVTRVRPTERIIVKSGEQYSFIVTLPHGVIDGHMHTQSGKCAPLPLLYAPIHDAIGINIAPAPRTWIENLAMFKEVGRVQKQAGDAIAARVCKENANTYSIDGNILSDEQYKDSDEFISIMVSQPMDMDYAHIAGYPPESSLIYHADGNKVIYYNRMKANAPETSGTIVDVSHERVLDKQKKYVWRFKDWLTQYSELRSAVLVNPLKILPMYNYDPRRWSKSESTREDRAWVYGPWNLPFKEIASETTPGLFLGFKMYPPLGYRPLDKRLPHLVDFYSVCQQRNIPILTHCSPGGMTTHESNFYCELDNVKLDPVDVISGAKPRCLGYNPHAPLGYFYDKYVHPKNWREVLSINPNLRLCLAHFGGDEWSKGGGEASDWVQEIIALTKEFPNVYTDVACFNLAQVKDAFGRFLRENKYPHLKDKFLFGTDWYLTLLVMGKGDYRVYCENFKKFFDGIDKSLWTRFTLLNPYEFYGLGNKNKMEKMAGSLKDAFDLNNKDKKQFETKIDEGMEKILGLQHRIDKIKSKQQ